MHQDDSWIGVACTTPIVGVVHAGHAPISKTWCTSDADTEGGEKAANYPQVIVGASAKNRFQKLYVLLSFGWPSSFFSAAASFFTTVSFLGAGLVLVFLSWDR